MRDEDELKEPPPELGMLSLLLFRLLDSSEYLLLPDRDERMSPTVLDLERPTLSLELSTRSPLPEGDVLLLLSLLT